MNKIAVILNPAARGEKAKSMGDKIRRLAQGSSFHLSPARGHTRLLARKAVEEGFKTIVAAEDYVNSKPAPDAFLLAAKRLGVRPETCLVFEDTDLGIQAAKAAGMASVRVPSPLERLAVR